MNYICAALHALSPGCHAGRCAAGEALASSSKDAELDGLQRSITQLQYALSETFSYVDDVVVCPRHTCSWP